LDRLPYRGQNKGDMKMKTEKTEKKGRAEEEKVAEEMFKRVVLGAA